jgi:hypothetical protein
VAQHRWRLAISEISFVALIFATSPRRRENR